MPDAEISTFTTRNIRKRLIDIHASGGIQTRNASKRSQNHALHRVATGIGIILGMAEEKQIQYERKAVYLQYVLTL
jgi:deoxyribose-phosphate aldolase